MTKGAIKDIVALSLVHDLGPVTFKKIMEHFGSAGAALSAPFLRLRDIAGISEAVAAGIKSPTLEAQATDELAHAVKAGIRILTADDPDYPSELLEIYAPPIVLYIKGDPSALRAVRFAIVGCRDASLYGRQTAGTIAKELAEAGVTVISGMAMGIDCAAHEGALAAGRPTAAVLGAGLSRIASGAPAEMARRILEAHGALISEFPLRMNAAPSHFPIRNRIISGLSSGVLVVEARARSGSLITADAALEQGREVYAVPGNVDSIRSQGTLRLLKQGAKLVTCADDILQDLSLTPRQGFRSGADANPFDAGADAVMASRAATLSAHENTLLSFLDREPRHVDELIENANLAPKEAITALSFLEIKGFAKQLPGKNYVSVQ